MDVALLQPRRGKCRVVGGQSKFPVLNETQDGTGWTDSFCSSGVTVHECLTDSWNATWRRHTFAVPVGHGLLVVVAAEGHALALQLLHFKARQDLLQVLHNVWEGRPQLGVHLAGTRGSTRLSPIGVRLLQHKRQKLHNFFHKHFNCNCGEWIIKENVGEFYGFYGTEEAPRVFDWLFNSLQGLASLNFTKNACILTLMELCIISAMKRLIVLITIRESSKLTVINHSLNHRCKILLFCNSRQF